MSDLTTRQPTHPHDGLDLGKRHSLRQCGRIIVATMALPTLMALPRMNEEEARSILADLSGSPTLSLIWLQEMLTRGWGEDLPFQHWMTVANA